MCMYICVCVCVCVRACGACGVCVCVRAYVRACVRASVRVCVMHDHTKLPIQMYYLCTLLDHVSAALAHGFDMDQTIQKCMTRPTTCK